MTQGLMVRYLAMIGRPFALRPVLSADPLGPTSKGIEDEHFERYKPDKRDKLNERDKREERAIPEHCTEGRKHGWDRWRIWFKDDELVNKVYLATGACQHRGKASTGIAIGNKKGIHIYKGLGRIADIIDYNLIKIFQDLDPSVP